MSTDTLTKLQAPFEEQDIEWKSQTVGISAGGSPYVLAVPYVTNRAIQKRLDEVFGVFGWENSYTPSTDGKGYLCGITAHTDDKSVTKWDGAECTNIEPLKGGLSNAMKRAAVQFGIGRYLYSLPEFWAECETTKGYKHPFGNVSKAKGSKDMIAWKNPTMPRWALPTKDYTPFFAEISKAESMEALKEAFFTAHSIAKTNQDQAAMDNAVKLKDAQKEVLNSAADLAATRCLSEAIKFYGMIPSIGALDTAHKSQLTKLKDTCKLNAVDADTYIQQLNNAHRIKTEEITNGAPA